MRRYSRVALGALASVCLLATLFAGPSAAANTVTVHVGCPGGSGNVKKLVQAVRDANLRAPTTTIIHLADACLYSFYRAHSFPVDGVRANALPVVRSHIVIHGHSANIRRVASAVGRFRFVAVDPQGELNLDNLVIAQFRARFGISRDSVVGGDGANATDGRDGGAIYNLGKVTLDDVSLSGNRAGNGGDGGWAIGLDAAAGTGDSADHMTGGNGGAGGRGGAIYSEGTLIITDSVLSDNRAGDGGTGGQASGGDGADAPTGSGGNGGNGGIATGGNGGPGGYGGAIYSSGVLSITNSTFAENRTGRGGDGGTASGGDGGDGANSGGAGGNGGSSNTLAASGGTGLAVYQWGGHADILNSTVSDNAGGNGGDSSSSSGSGGNGGCEGAAGSAGSAGAGSGNGGFDALRADNGATLTTTGTIESGTSNGVSGIGSLTSGANGSAGGSCT